MTTAIPYVGGAILCACVIFVWWLIRHSPEAHQDKEGFHKGAVEKPARENPKSESKVA